MKLESECRIQCNQKAAPFQDLTLIYVAGQNKRKEKYQVPVMMWGASRTKKR